MSDAHYRFERILVERRADGIVVFTINRPGRMNASDDVLHREFALLPRLFDEDDAAQVAVLTGAGKAFSAGGDYAAIAAEADDYVRKLAMTRETLQIVSGLLDCRKPIVSAINGPAAGAGLTMALLADISIVNEDTVLCDGHTRIGLAAGDHAALIWPLLCGMAKAKLHLLTCRKIKGREAERIGLVSEAVSADQVLSRALEIAAELAALPPLGVEFTKRALNLWLRQAMPMFEASLGYELLTSFNPELATRVQQVAKRAGTMSDRLRGRVAIITGGASGIGLASAERFVAEGAKVVIADIDDAAGRQIESRYHGELRYVHCDVAIDAEVEALVAAAVAHFDRLDIMFNNAGIQGDRAGFTEIEASSFEAMLRLLTGSVVSGHKYAARQFRKQNSGGAILSTTSAAGLLGGYSNLCYTTAKHAIIGVVRAATFELAPHGIRSNAIAPGVTVSPIMASSFGVPPERAEAFQDFVAERCAVLQPAKRAGRPIDIANAALFLCSDEAEWISGVVLPVDGGGTAITHCDPTTVVAQAGMEFLKAGS